MTSNRAAAHRGDRTLRATLVAAGWEEGHADLVERMPHRLAHAAPRRPFREPGASADEWMLVRSGILSQFIVDGSGRRQIVALYFPGEFILPREGAVRPGIEAIVRSELFVGKACDFDALLNSSPDLWRLFFSLLYRSQAISGEWLVNCGRRDATSRIAHLLCEVAVRLGVENEPTMVSPFTQQQIGELTGQTSVNVNRVLQEMERSGLMKRKGRHIDFVDWPAMRRLGNFRADYLQM